MSQRIPLSIEVKKVMKLLIATLLALLVFGSVYFFLKTSNTAEKGYVLKESQIRKEELEAQQRILQKRVLNAQSMNELKKSDTVGEMAEPDKQIYLIPRGPIGRKN
jgi:uncharacterized protein YxeA